ncbi:MAG: hypothetical protein HZB38_06205 [Planctomycetes bacterium]|nr:hypothetical protein [Planctomycetota bacterium]
MTGRSVNESIGAYASLADLRSAILPQQGYADLGVTIVAARELPPHARELLVHEGHMTVRLRDWYRTELLLRVLAQKRADGLYSREVLLLRADSQAPVEYGVVRMHETLLPAGVVADIHEARRLLGDILMSHGVLLRVEPRWYFAFDPQGREARQLGACSAFGRFGVIHCNHQPAIEVLEVVAGEPC